MVIKTRLRKCSLQNFLWPPPLAGILPNTILWAFVDRDILHRRFIDAVCLYTNSSRNKYKGIIIKLSKLRRFWARIVSFFSSIFSPLITWAKYINTFSELMSSKILRVDNVKNVVMTWQRMFLWRWKFPIIFLILALFNIAWIYPSCCKQVLKTSNFVISFLRYQLADLAQGPARFIKFFYYNMLVCFCKIVNCITPDFQVTWYLTFIKISTKQNLWKNAFRRKNCVHIRYENEMCQWHVSCL